MTRIFLITLTVLAASLPASAQRLRPLAIPAEVSKPPEAPARAVAPVTPDPSTRVTIPVPLKLACDRLTQSSEPAQGVAGGSEVERITTALSPFLGEIGTGEAVMAVLTDLKLDKDSAWPNAAPNQKQLLVRQALWLTGTCAQLVAYDAAAKEKDDGVAGHEALVTGDLSLTRLGAWQAPLHRLALDGAASSVATHASKVLEDSKERVSLLMRQHDLSKLFSAALFTGTALSTQGVTLQRQAASTTGRVQVAESEVTQPVTLLSVESMHWGSRGESRFDGSVRGLIGFKPVETLASITAAPAKAEKAAADAAKPAADAAAPELQPGLASILRPALLLGFGGRLGWFSRRSMEASIVGQAIASRLTSDKVIVDASNPDTLIARRANDTNLTQWAGELGLEVKLFDAPIRLVHAEGGLATPALSVGAGFRYDSRFHPTGSLADLGLDRPERRLYARVLFDPVKFVDSREVGEPGKTLTFGFGFDYEKPWFGTRTSSVRVPDSFRFIIMGDLNILRAVSGDAKKDAAKKSEGTAAPAGAAANR